MRRFVLSSILLLTAACGCASSNPLAKVETKYLRKDVAGDFLVEKAPHMGEIYACVFTDETPRFFCLTLEDFFEVAMRSQEEEDGAEFEQQSESDSL